MQHPVSFIGSWLYSDTSTFTLYWLNSFNVSWTEGRGGGWEGKRGRGEGTTSRAQMNQWHCTTGCSIYYAYLNVSSIYSMCNWFIEFHHQCLSNFTGISLLLHKKKTHDNIQLSSLDFRCSQHSFVWVHCVRYLYLQLSYQTTLKSLLFLTACTQIPSPLVSPPPFSPQSPFSSDATLYIIQYINTSGLQSN